MKIGLTGHTRGFGQELSRQAESLGFEITGFSKSTGYDITLKSDRKRIVQESMQCDVFINNAYDRYGQIDLLYDMYSAWKGQPKKIITIGSYASNAAEWRLKPCLYSTIKKALDVATYQLVNSHDRGELTVSVIKPGYMGDDHQLSFGQVATQVLHLITQSCEIVEIVVKS